MVVLMDQQRFAVSKDTETRRTVMDRKTTELSVSIHFFSRCGDGRPAETQCGGDGIVLVGRPNVI